MKVAVPENNTLDPLTPSAKRGMTDIYLIGKVFMKEILMKKERLGCKMP